MQITGGRFRNRSATDGAKLFRWPLPAWMNIAGLGTCKGRAGTGVGGETLQCGGTRFDSAGRRFVVGGRVFTCEGVSVEHMWPG